MLGKIHSRVDKYIDLIKLINRNKNVSLLEVPVRL